ncbi:hypothetical protein K1S89_26845 [Klebsiella pneumoniae]|nr:hypothetical protein [Klebsiella pneumoniae]MCA5403416.1 hypothetical protein [Klebsiella pneumoniae]
MNKTKGCLIANFATVPYELCALSEMKNALRSGDIWVQGSRESMKNLGAAIE